MKKEKMILFIILVLIILIVCILGLVVILKNKEAENNKTATDEVIMREEIHRKLTPVTTRGDYYIVQNCIERFYTYYGDVIGEQYDGYVISKEEDKQKIRKQRIEKVYNLLDKEYIEKEQITQENLITKINEIENTSILIKDMYYIEKDERISSYFVYGAKQVTSNSEATDVIIMLKMDSQNRTFKLLFGDCAKNYYESFKNGQEIELEEQEIKNDKYNTFAYDHIAEDEYISDLFRHFKQTLRFYKEYSYNLLDTNYRNICFENVNDYLSYLDSNYSKIAIAKIKEYTKNIKDGHTEYLFKDNKGRYYIFKETAPFKYTVILDSYTMQHEEFTSEYNNSSEAEKVVLNIKKFFMGIDDKNYGYSYSVLSEGFRNNKYPTKNDFINYAKQNFFEKNEIEYVKYEKENGLYIYKIKLADASGKNTTEKTFNIIIRLKSGTDFEMSLGTD